MKQSLRIFILSLLCVLVAFGATLYGLSATANSTRSLCVVLDAGHGGIDCGVIGLTTGAKESDTNLAIVKRIGALLEDSAIRPVYTRKTQAGLYGVVGKGMKRRDMESRKRIIEKANPVAILSIHQNSYPQNTSRCGGQVFYRADHEPSKQLATAVQKSLNSANPFYQGMAIHAGDYYLLNCTEIPSVIVECGFFTNEAEEKLLLTEEYQTQLAESIVQGLLSFLAVHTGNS